MLPFPPSPKTGVSRQPITRRYRPPNSVACAGYRVASVPGHHRLTFEAAGFALGKPAAPLTDYFDACRRKRNLIDYTGVAVATGTEAEELLLHARSFLNLVEGWIEANHPTLRQPQNP